MALIGKTDAPAHVLLAHIKEWEAELGRQPRGKWGPREIDIDILAMDDAVMSNDSIRIPHAELFNRDFALLPFCELAPHWRNPVEGAYYGWKAADIARDKGFYFGDRLQRTEYRLHV